MKQKLTLSPDTFLWRKGTEGLLYESARETMFHFNVTDSIRELCRVFEDYDNLYSASFDPETLDNDARSFIDEITTRGFGRITSSETPIISLPPMLNIQHDVKRLKQDPEREIGDNVLEYLSSLTIYIGGLCCNKSYFKQIIYPICSEEHLSSETIVRFLDKVWTPSLQRINLVVSDVTDREIIQMEQRLKAYKEQIVFYVLYAGLHDKTTAPYTLAKAGYRVRFICEQPDNVPKAFDMEKPMEKEQRLSLPFGYDLIVRNDREYREWSELVEKLEVKDFAMVPVYDDNKEFFDCNVFLSEADIKQIRLSRREIFAHQAVNIEAFGNLIVMPDGRIYSDVTAPSLGTIDDSIYDLIVRELQENYAWRKIRDSESCKNCVYQWLCPSPSPYERATGKKTVCTFRENG